MADSHERPALVLVPDHPFEVKWELAQKRYRKTIRTFARNFVNQLPGFDIEDVEQELLMMLWKCVNNYDPNRGASFNTLFQGTALRRCISLVRTANTKGRKGVTVSLDVEAIGQAVNDYFSEDSAEDNALRRLQVVELVEEFGDKVLEGKCAKYFTNTEEGQERRAAVLGA